jgi:hypothetical protein
MAAVVRLKFFALAVGRLTRSLLLCARRQVVGNLRTGIVQTQTPLLDGATSEILRSTRILEGVYGRTIILHEVTLLR